MTDWLQAKNNASSTLASDITDSDTTLEVASGEGARFPSLYPFHISVDDEIMECTNRSGDTLTITREAESTSKAAHRAGAAVRLNITAQIISQLQDEARDYSVMCYKSVNQSIPNATGTILTFDCESWDTDAQHDNSSNNSRLTCQKAGRYLVTCHVYMPSAGAGNRDIRFYANGGIRHCSTRQYYATAGTFKLTATELIDLAVNDYVEVNFYHDIGSAKDVYGAGSAAHTRFGMTRIGE